MTIIITHCNAEESKWWLHFTVNEMRSNGWKLKCWFFTQYTGHLIQVPEAWYYACSSYYSLVIVYFIF